ncbi:hypothetical protein OJAV_G00072850 [Oryzias javanicus]|uniref:IBB domain-containing protein n=1 Tax=Oryzias javanicus TaxID=123683 RepID=A0A437D1S4_ORYJA|nr:hypothetical protein OJAV_G00072850 [Oryzias javanicus]
MSAAHWEARRCQNALERRMARDRRLLQSSETSKNAPELNTAPKDPANHCEMKVKMPSNQDAKLSNRFSSLEYVQQW